MGDTDATAVDGSERPRNLPRLAWPDTDRHDYRVFPAKVVSRASIWFRNHSLRTADPDFGAWYFTARTPGEDPEGRFDLSVEREGVGLGTCYLASTERGAVNEFLGPDYFDRGFVDGPLLAGRVVSELELPRDIRAANALSSDAFGFQVNSELFNTDDYELTQAYANRFAEDGFDGLLSRPRFSTDDSVALAMYGPQGAPEPKPAGDPRPKPIRPLIEEWGLQIEDPPAYDSVDVVA